MDDKYDNDETTRGVINSIAIERKRGMEGKEGKEQKSCLLLLLLLLSYYYYYFRIVF